MSSISLIFRVDASLSIGTGHLYRTLNLARGFQRRGINSLFICRNHLDSIHRSIIAKEFPCIELPPIDNPGYQPDSSHPYLSWLGCSEISDAHDTINLLLSHSYFDISYIVIDHYAIGIDWERCFLEQFPSTQIIALDDLHNRPHEAVYRSLYLFLLSSYKNLLPSHCKLLAGYFALVS